MKKIVNLSLLYLLLSLSVKGQLPVASSTSSATNNSLPSTNITNALGNSYEFTSKTQVFKFRYDPTKINYTNSDIVTGDTIRWASYLSKFDLVDTISISLNSPTSTGKSDTHMKKFYIIKFWEFKSKGASHKANPVQENGGRTSNEGYNINKTDSNNNPGNSSKKNVAKPNSNKTNHTPNSSSEKISSQTINYSDSNTYFCLEEDMFKTTTEIITPKNISWFVATSTTIPFVVRTGSQADFLDYSPSATVGFVGGFKKKTSFTLSNYVDYFLFGGVSSVLVDSATTTRKNEKAKYIGSQQIAAATAGLGVAVDFKGGEIGLFMGFDFVGPEYSNKWIYQGLPWLGISIGASLFSNGSSASSPANTN